MITSIPLYVASYNEVPVPCLSRFMFSSCAHGTVGIGILASVPFFSLKTSEVVSTSIPDFVCNQKPNFTFMAFNQSINQSIIKGSSIAPNLESHCHRSDNDALIRALPELQKKLGDL